MSFAVGEKIRWGKELATIVAAEKVGTSIKLQIKLHDGSLQTTTVQVGTEFKKPEDAPPPPPPPPTDIFDEEAIFKESSKSNTKVKKR